MENNMKFIGSKDFFEVAAGNDPCHYQIEPVERAGRKYQ
jgi:hypothetical protein